MISPKTASTKVLYGFLAIAYASAFTLSIAGFLIGRWHIFFIFKALFMPCVSLYAHLSWEGTRARRYVPLQLAFLFAWIGDVILGLPRVHPIILKLGGASFLFQHVFYIGLNISAKGSQKSLLKTPLWGFPTISYAVLFSLIYWSKGGLIDKLTCALYAAFLATSFYTSFYREISSLVKYWTCIVGFGLFVLSDMLIIMEEFIFALTPLESSMILVTYYIAQSLICYTHVCESATATALQTT